MSAASVPTSTSGPVSGLQMGFSVPTRPLAATLRDDSDPTATRTIFRYSVSAHRCVEVQSTVTLPTLHRPRVLVIGRVRRS